MHRYVRPAKAGDVPAMLALMQPYMDDGTLLPRDEDDLYQHLQEFMLAFLDGHLAGVVALHVYAEDLAEIRSLVVARNMQREGVGESLIRSCESSALTLGIVRLFALTYVKKFFLRLGYQVVVRESLPHKIWTVCIHCAKFSHCDETAVEKRLPSQYDSSPLEGHSS